MHLGENDLEQDYDIVNTQTQTKTVKANRDYLWDLLLGLLCPFVVPGIANT